MNKTTLIMLLIVILSFLIGILLYPSMPDVMASHWDINGLVDGYTSKFWGLFLMPIISSIMLVLFLVLPKIDPLKKNVSTFRKYYNNFILIILVFLFGLYLFTLLWNTGTTINIIYFFVPSLSILFYYAGVLMAHSKPNWFIGIKTPWTLSSDKVWNKTHILGSKLFKTMSVIMLVSLLLPSYAFIAVIFLLLIASAYLVLYSYLEYKKL